MNSKAGNGTVRKANLMHKPTRKSADKRQTITELQEDLKRTREQLFIMHEKYVKSKQGKKDLAASEEARIQELREVFQERDRSWQSELQAVQNSCINEIQGLKVNHSKLMKMLRTQLLEKSEEIERLTFALEASMIKHYEDEVTNIIVVQYAFELEEQLRNEILEREDHIRNVLRINKNLHLENEEMKEQIMLKENMEVELKKLRVQSKQWRKASEVAMNLISIEKTGKNARENMNFPYVYNWNKEAKKTKNGTVFTRMGEFWKSQR